MGAGHSHGLSISAAGQQRGRMLLVLALTATILVAEVVGGWLTGSLALLADAGHMFTDVASMSLAILAVSFARKPPTDTRTYGFYRLEILAAAFNAVLLFGVAVVILVEAWSRWYSPPGIAGGAMLGFAAIGLLANTVSLFILRAGSKQSLNVRAAYLEVAGDILGSAAVIVAAITIAITGWERADIVASILVALMILPRTWALLREATDVLLEAVPKGTDLPAIRQHILETPGVLDTHDLHVWTLTSGIPVLSVHIVVSDEVLAENAGGRVLDALHECLAHHFDVQHCTFQLEPVGHTDHEGLAHR